MHPVNYIEKGEKLHFAIRAAGHVLEQVNGQWLADDATAVQSIIDGYDPLPEAKASKWEAIKAERDRRKEAGYMVAGHRYHSDPSSRIQQIGLVIMGAGIPAGLQWKTMDNGLVPMTQALAQQIFATTANNDATLHAVAEMKKAALYALTGLASVESFDVLGGWPVV